MIGKLVFEDGSIFEGESFGFNKSTAGEVVFSTGMVGYPESLTDPSYFGQILLFTYPIIGNYGVPEKRFWESDRIQVSGLIVSNYIDTPSHHQSKQTLKKWLLSEQIPALEIKDTRFLTQKIRKKGTMLGKIVIEQDVPFCDPNQDNLVAKVSARKVYMYTPRVAVHNRGQKTILLIDCGAKQNITRCLLKRGIRVIVIPWDFNPFERKLNFDAIVVSNGPGDPKKVRKTIQTVQEALTKKVPTLGICLGHQLLALAAGGNTRKLKFGHRSQNQPCLLEKSNRCYITTQNHGFTVSRIPKDFKPWFTNANDQSNEGIIHKKLPLMSVQFHPEATPGPVDTEWIFDYFLKRL